MGSKRSSNRLPYTLIALLILGLLALARLVPGLNIQVQFDLPTPTPQPAVQALGEADWYQLYFTTPRYPDRPETRASQIDAALAAFIDTAHTQVDVAIFQLDLPNVTQALLDAQKRGAAVRVVTDIDILQDEKENEAFNRLEQAQIPVRAGNPNAIMHNKFVVVDEAAVWTGAWNFTANDTFRYNNNGILIQSAQLARNYRVTFEKMFEGAFGRKRRPGGTTPVLTVDGVTIENYFAPEDKVTDKIVARLQQAQASIDFMAFSFTSDEIGQVLRQRAKAGVTVRGIFEKTGSETSYSEYNLLKQAGLEVWQDGNPYLMHHKVFIVDDRTVILGSFNFSRSATEDNDENLLIIDDPALAQQFKAEFERVLAQAKGASKD